MSSCRATLESELKTKFLNSDKNHVGVTNVEEDKSGLALTRAVRVLVYSSTRIMVMIWVNVRMLEWVDEYRTWEWVQV